MRILRHAIVILVTVLFWQEVHAAAAKPGAKGKKKAPKVKVITKVDTLRQVDTVQKVDTLKKVDTLEVANQELKSRKDSLTLALGRCQASLHGADTLLGVMRARESGLTRSLDSTRRSAKDLSILLGRQTDSMRVLDSLRRTLAPDSTLVLFLPVSFDTARHPKDSVLAQSLTRSLHAVALQQKRYALWIPKGGDQGCNRSECWSEIASRKGAGKVLTGTLAYSGDTLMYSTSMVSLATGQVERQSLVIGYHREADPSGRFSRMAASQLFGVKNEMLEDKHVDSPLWRRVALLGIFAVFAGTVTAISW